MAKADGAVVGMATCSRRLITGWNGPVIFLQDLFVEPSHRRRGMARALTARVAALACELGSPIVELTVGPTIRRKSFTAGTALRRCHSASPMCEACKGFRLKPEALCVKVGGLHIGEVSNMSVKGAAAWFTELPQRLTTKQNEIAVINYAYPLLESQGIAPANVEIGEAALPALSR